MPVLLGKSNAKDIDVSVLQLSLEKLRAAKKINNYRQLGPRYIII